MIFNFAMNDLQEAVKQT